MYSLKKVMDFIYTCKLLKQVGLEYGLDIEEAMSILLGDLKSNNYQYQADIFSDILDGLEV